MLSPSDWADTKVRHYDLQCAAYQHESKRMTHGDKKIRVAVVFGGRSDEHDVSLRSARTIMDALDSDRYEIVPIGISRAGQWLAGSDPMSALIAESPMFALAEGEDVAVPSSKVEITR